MNTLIAILIYLFLAFTAYAIVRGGTQKKTPKK